MDSNLLNTLRESLYCRELPMKILLEELGRDLRPSEVREEFIEFLIGNKMRMWLENLTHAGFCVRTHSLDAKHFFKFGEYQIPKGMLSVPCRSL